jgi:diketogulonate reductase-like aldo/keto reductase
MVEAAMSPAHMVATGKPYLVYGTGKRKSNRKVQSELHKQQTHLPDSLRALSCTAWKKEQTATYVAQAIRAGFRFIDTACQPKHYNEAGVGEGWTTAAAELSLTRKDFFLQTKYTSIGGQDPTNVPYHPTDPLPLQVQTSLQVSLKNLRTDYLDSLVLHSPMPTMEETLTVWRTMESFVKEGHVKQLGISNCYDLGTFQDLYDQAEVKPAVLQNRFTADTNFDTELREYCHHQGVTYQSFWTLTANRHALASPAVVAWAERLDMTPQQLMFAFLLSLGYVRPLSGTTSLAHMADDVAIMERMQSKDDALFTNDTEVRRFAKLLGMPAL